MAAKRRSRTRSSAQVAAQKKAAAASAAKRKGKGSSSSGGKLTQALAQRRAKYGSTRRQAQRLKLDKMGREEGFNRNTLNHFMRREGGPVYRNPKLHNDIGATNKPRGQSPAGKEAVRVRKKGDVQANLRGKKIQSKSDAAIAKKYGIPKKRVKNGLVTNEFGMPLN